MKRIEWCCLVAALAALAACATPEVAKTYEEKTLVPTEIESALQSDDPTRRAEAAKQIEVMEPAQSKAVLLELLGHENSAVRLLAVNSLAKHHLGDDAVVGALTDALSLDPDQDVRLAVVGALSRCGKVPGLAAIVAALGSDSSLLVKQEAALVLDKLTGQSGGAGFVKKVEDADMASDDAMMFYEDWLEQNAASLRWDPARSRFTGGR